MYRGVAEQLEIASTSIEVGWDYLENIVSPLSEFFASIASLLRRELDYHASFGNWLDFDAMADFGNQSVECGLVGSNMIENTRYGTFLHSVCPLDLHNGQHEAAQMDFFEPLQEFERLLDAIENGEADGFDPESYDPNEPNANGNLDALNELLESE